MQEIIKNLSTLTTINSRILAKLCDKIIYCINDAIEEDVLENKELTELDIGIGTLKILHTEDEIKYKFIPSQKLESSIIDTVKGKKNLLDKTVEEAVVDKITNIYKDLF